MGIVLFWNLKIIEKDLLTLMLLLLLLLLMEIGLSVCFGAI